MMSDARISFSVSGVPVVPGDHLCALFRGDAGRDEILLPFLTGAVCEGDKVIGVLDEEHPREVLARVEGGVGPATDGPEQFDLFRTDDTYLRGAAFQLQEMLEFWVERVSAAMADGRFRYVRSIGEMTWALRDVPGVDDLVRYESELNRSVWRHPCQVSVCMYDLERFVDGGLVLDILRTHPKVLLGGTVLENPWYIGPDELLASQR